MFSENRVKKIQGLLKSQPRPLLVVKGLGLNPSTENDGDETLFVIISKKLQDPSSNRFYNEFVVRDLTPLLEDVRALSEDTIETHIDKEQSITLTFPNEGNISYYILKGVPSVKD